MGTLVESIDISRRPEEVFNYAIDFEHFPEWQKGVTSARREGHGSIVVGSTARVARRVGPRVLATTERLTQLSSPHRWGVRGEGGLPVNGILSGSIDPLDSGWHSRVTLALDFEATNSLGKALLRPFVGRTTKRALRHNVAMLKAALEETGHR